MQLCNCLTKLNIQNTAAYLERLAYLNNFFRWAIVAESTEAKKGPDGQ